MAATPASAEEQPTLDLLALRVLHDAFGARSVFYSLRAPLAVASHSMLLGRLLGIRLSSRSRELIKSPAYTKRKARYLPGDITLFDDVFALIPNNLYDSATPNSMRSLVGRLQQPAAL